MAVRRLAETQPESFAFTAENDNWAQKQIGKYPPGRQASAVIPLLWRAQEQEGWISEPAIRTVARMLDMPYIRVLEIATFYTMFHLAPVGTRAHVQVCGTTPCMLRGAQSLTDLCRRRIHPEPRQPSADGAFSWEEVECLGACVNAPMVQIGKDYYEDLSVESLEAILDAIGRGDTPEPGPQIDRISSAPVGGPTSLIDEEGLRQGRSSRQAIAEEEAETVDEQATPPDTEAMKQEAVAHPTSTDRSDAEAARSDPTDEPDTEIGLGKDEEKTAAVETADPDTTGTKRAELPADKARKPKQTGVMASEPAGATSAFATAPQTEEADTAGERPPGLSEPRGGKPDDLKKIRGIGKVSEKALNGLGIYHYDQIAAWTPAQVRWVGTRLSFPGRIDREEWVEQASRLAGSNSDAKGEKA